ncbi:MAG TPA: hypothetical protein DDX39_10465, partial [Bacteroidales bacterium]|nr:hypothetical protein [Bacteroidales bacterium]
PYTYAWTGGATAQDLSGVGQGTYTLTVTDDNGCTDTQAGVVTEPAILAVTLNTSVNVSCNGDNDGSININVSGGTSPYTYLWDDGSAQTIQDPINLIAGTFEVTVTDDNGCQAIFNTTIVEPLALALSVDIITDVDCNGDNTGSATVSASNGTAPYTFTWSNAATGTNVTGLIAGAYDVTVVDSHGCRDSATITINEPAVLTLTLTPSDASCNGVCDGDISTAVVGGTTPYSYAWSNLATTATINTLCDGTYDVTVTDANGCEIIDNATINEPVSMVLTMTHEDATCGNPDGDAEVAIAGGTAPYSILWSTTETTDSIENLLANSYTVAVTDANLCVANASVNISDVGGPTAVLDSTFDASCFGLSDGSAYITVSGGTTPYVFTWNDPATQSTEDATGLAAGNYTVNIMDDNSCATSVNVTIAEPLVLNSSITGIINNPCNGDALGTANLTVTGGTTPYTYVWSDGQMVQDPINLVDGLYDVTITDANGCQKVTPLTITEPTAVSIVQDSLHDVLCNGGNTGGIYISVSGGTGAYTYSWDNGPATQDNTGLSIGTYEVTATDANGCTDVYSTTVNQPVDLTGSLTANNETINGNCDGTATVSATNGGVSPYSYAWETGATTIGISGLCVDNYEVTITDANGCTEVLDIDILGPDALVLSITADTLLCNGDSDGQSLVSAIGGIPPYSYAWEASVITFNDSLASGLSAGTYDVTVTDVMGASNSISVTIVEPTALVASISGITSTDCFGSSDGSISASAIGGTLPYSYAWPSGAGATSSGLISGTYEVTVTDGNGCTSTASDFVPEPTDITASVTTTDVLCNGGNTGSATVIASGGTGTLEYLWDDADAQDVSTASNVIAGTYNVIVTDANGCTETASGVVGEPTVLSISVSLIDDVSCNGGSDGQTTVSASGGISPYTYSWDAGSTNDTLLTAMEGTQFVTITDSNLCTISGSVLVSEPLQLSTSFVVTDAHCELADGELEVNVVGGVTPYVYAWSNGQSTDIASSIFAGTHIITITDANLCTFVDTATVLDLPGVTSVISTVNNANCYAACDGTALVVGSVGDIPYTYSWDNGQTTALATGLCAGSYSVTVTDVNGCTHDTIAIVGQPDSVDVSISASTDVLCFGQNNGTATATTIGGTSPYNYVWNGGSTPTVATTTGLMAGTYFVTATDSKGCTDTASVNIYEPTSIALVMSSVDENCGQANGEGSVLVSGGTSPYSYSWNGGTTATSSTTIGLSQGTYTVNVTDDNGCTASNTVSITNITAGTASISSSQDVSCFGLCDGTAVVSIGGGASPYSYSWSSGSTTTTASNLCAGDYDVSITDANNCIVIVDVTISAPSQLSVSLNSDQVTCFGGSDGSAEAIPSGGESPYTYQWDDLLLQTTQTASGLMIGTYHVTVEDDNGCEVYDEVTLVQPPKITFSDIVSDASCGQADGAIDLTVTGGVAPYVYSWNNGVYSTQDITNIVAGTYTVSIIDNKNCREDTTIQVNNILGPTVTISSFTNASCNGVCDGTATVSVSQGTSPFSYEWDNSQVSTIATNLCDGLHSVTVTDANGCEASASKTITEPFAIALSTSFTEPLCNDSCNGSASVISVGGTSPYSYQWDGSSDTTSTVRDMCSGTYYVTVTDSHGCEEIADVVISQPTILTFDISSVKTFCYGSCDGTATVSPYGGTAPYTQEWQGGQTSITAIGLCAGMVDVTVTDDNGCTVSGDVEVLSPTQLVVSIDNFQHVDCYGDSSGYAVPTINGGTPGYSYSWSNSTSSGSLLDISAGLYNLTVTDSKLCQDTASVLITQPPVLNITLFSVDETCYEYEDGSINSTITGGVLPYSYAWSTAQGTEDVADLACGTYILTVIDANGCRKVARDTILCANQLIVSEQSVTPANCGLATGGAQVGVIGGELPYTSSMWETGTTGTILSYVASGQYTFTVVDAKGCVDSLVVGINDLEAPYITLLDPTDVLCNGDSDGSINMEFAQAIIDAPFEIEWSTSFIETVTNPMSSSISALSATEYFVTITDASGCHEYGNVVVSEPAQLHAIANSIIPATCNGYSDGQINIITAGGTPAYSYLWTNGNLTSHPNNLSANFTQFVTITDANGCQIILDTIIPQPDPLTMTATVVDALCYGSDEGSSIDISAVGGNGIFTYNWNPSQGSTEPVYNVMAGDYYVTVTDHKGCRADDMFTVGEPTQIQLTTDNIPTTCKLNNGTAIVNALGGTGTHYSYSWIPNLGAYENEMDSVTEGWYNVVVYDENNCSESTQVKVDMVPLPVIESVVITDATCNGYDDGFVVVNPSFGTHPSSYTLNPVSATEYWLSDSAYTFTGLIAGQYVTTLIDVNGCEVQRTFDVDEPNAITAFVSGGNNTLCIGQQIQLSAYGLGGTPDPLNGYNYEWTTFGEPSVISQNYILEAKDTVTYQVLISDMNHCEGSTSITVNVFPEITIEVSPSDTTICQGETITLIVDADGGDGSSYSYYWTDLGVPTSMFSRVVSPVVGTTYFVSVTDECNSPSDTFAVNVNVHPIPQLQLVGDTIASCPPLTTTFSNLFNDSTYTYEWNFGDGSSDDTSEEIAPSHEFLYTGTYSVYVTVTDTTSGCYYETVYSDYIEVYPEPIAAMYIYPSTVNVFDGGVNFYNESIGSDAVVWNFGDNEVSTIENPEHQYTQPGEFEVLLTAMTQQGCLDTVVGNVIVNEGFTFYAPNAFTPESNRNDYFFFKGIGIDPDNFYYAVYDRWGELIFETDVFYNPESGYTDVKGAWDGTVHNSGALVEMGVYTWRVVLKEVTGKSHEIAGTVTVIR